ncbi:MAG: NAD-dependent epimerase/dehydratase family protein [Candidatus Omnitrophota bacterium]|jgi:nucleoside-diphosphate-sugar epimerase|nr:NAD-dependent epimerase/dehydratase family protein [Candidatus Omnitrophota bacterium]
MNKDLRIFITGATGFIGRFLLSELFTRGYKNITVLARPTSNLGLLKAKDIQIILADITDKASLDNIKGSYDIVFHCAGFVNDGNEKILGNVNIRGTENICKWALECRVKKLVYLSSVAVNSGNTQIPLTEDMPYKATNRYGFSKLEAEKIALRYRDIGLPMAILRPCMVYGPGEPHMLPLLARLMKWRLLLLPNRGETKLHLVSVRNVSACLVHFMENDRAIGGVFHIADNEVLDVGEIFGIFSKAMDAGMPLLLSYPLTRLFTLIPVLGRRVQFLCKDRVYSLKHLKDILNFNPPYSAFLELAESVKEFGNNT